MSEKFSPAANEQFDFPVKMGVFDFTPSKFLLETVQIFDRFFHDMESQRELWRRTYQGNVVNAFHPDDRRGIFAAAMNAIKNGTTFRHRVRVRPGGAGGKGKWLWVSLVGDHEPVGNGAERFYVSFSDASGTIKAEKELSMRERLLKIASLNSSTLYFVYDMASRTATTIMHPKSFPPFPERFEHFPDSLFEITKMPDNDRESFREMLRKIEGGADEATCDVQMRRRDRMEWMRVKLINSFDENGNPTETIGYVERCDALKHAEKVLANERAMIASLSKHIFLAVAFNATRDTYLDALPPMLANIPDVDEGSELFREAIEAEPDIAHQKPATRNVLFATARTVIDPRIRKKIFRDFSHAGLLRLFHEDKRELRMEYQRLIDCHIMWVETRLVMLPDPATGDVLAFFYTRDITRNKQWEEILSLTLAQSSDFISLVDAKACTVTYRSVSDEWQKLFPDLALDVPFTGDKIAESIKNALGITPPPLAEQIRTVTDNIDRTGSFVSMYEYTDKETGKTRRKQLSYYWLSKAHHDILQVQQDITLSYEREQKHTEELRRAVEAAEASNRAKTDFVSRISHDIRTPIGAIQNLVTFAREDINDPEKISRDLDRIESSSTFLLSLINDVLDLSKINSGKITLSPTPCSYNDFIKDIVNMLEPMCSPKDISARVRCEEADIPLLLLDKIRVKQILMNIISNAVKYTLNGGEVEFSARADMMPDGRIMTKFIVSDNGIGMSEEFQRHMFEDFSQEQDNPARVAGTIGTGLGLAIVKRLIDLMGGTIAVKSERGKGSTFTITLPFESAGHISHDDAGSDDDNVSIPLNLHVLLVEDNEINVEIAARILDDFNVTHEHAGNGRQAVDLFGSRPEGTYDAILMDMQMPILSGMGATRQIRAMDRRDAKSIPIIAMTADAFEESMKKAKDAGVNEYITKPIDPQTLHRILKKMTTKNGKTQKKYSIKYD